MDDHLKTLVDCLRMPQCEQEVPGRAHRKVYDAQPHTDLFCLLEDDSLIPDLHIRTHRLNNPNPDPNHAEVRIEIEVKGFRPHPDTKDY